MKENMKENMREKPYPANREKHMKFREVRVWHPDIHDIDPDEAPLEKGEKIWVRVLEETGFWYHRKAVITKIPEELSDNPYLAQLEPDIGLSPGFEICCYHCFAPNEILARSCSSCNELL